MTTDRRAALVEKVARRMGEVISLWLHEHPGCVLEDVDTAYIATAAIDLIRADALEEAAKELERFGGLGLAAKIRALKGAP
jgi:hypothetical protein